uniref:ZP domain-containing protein n=1 Tax=Knipowitschia caucasica TaxID=637954 RepID=A0AAV2MG49_KNICA
MEPSLCLSVLLQRAHLPPGPSPSGAVDLWCGLRSVGVRVDRLRLRHWSVPGLFRLSSCPVSAASARYLYFHRGLGECGCDVKVLRGQLVYHFSLSYAAPQGSVLRVPPLNLPLSCFYNRFHYSYRVGYQPLAPPSSFMKSMQSRASFSLSVCNSHWEAWPPGQELVLGEPVYLVARVRVVLPGETLYVDTCRVTSSEDPESSPRLDLITNHGCMTDSAQAHSGSRFVWRGPGELRFSVDSLLFSSEPQMMFLHCSMSLALKPSPSSKSCSYSRDTGRWQELEPSFSSVCSCCDSVCGAPEDPVKPWVSSPSFHLTHHHKVQPFMNIHKTGSTEEQQEALRIHKAGPTEKEEQQEALNIHKAGPTEKEELQQQEAVSLKSRGKSPTEELQQEEAVSMRSRGESPTEELQQEEAVSMRSRGESPTKELQQEEAVSMRSRGESPTVELQQEEEAVSMRSRGESPTKELQQEEAVSMRSRGAGGALTGEQQVSVRRTGAQVQSTDSERNIQGQGQDQSQDPERNIQGQNQEPERRSTQEPERNIQGQNQEPERRPTQEPERRSTQEPERNIQGQNQEPERRPTQEPERSIQDQNQDPERSIQGQEPERRPMQEPETQPLDQTPVNPLENRTSTGPNS